MANQIQNNIASSLTGADLGLNATYLGTLWQNNLIPAWKKDVLNVFGTSRLTSWIDMNSTVSTRPATTFYHKEQGYMQDVLVASGAASGAAGAAVTITITAGSLAGTKSPVAEGFTIIFKDGSVGQITDIASEATMEVTPALSTQAISVADGESFIYAPASNVLEGSCSGNSATQVLPTTFTATMQSVRLDETITDDAWVSFSSEINYFEWGAADGKSYPCWTAAALINRETQFHNARELTALTGRSFSNTSLTGSGYLGTNGVIPVIQTNGNIQPYFAGAGVQIADFEDVCIQMEKQQSPREYISSGGVEFNRDAFKAIKDYFPNGAVSYGAFGGSQENAIEWGFTSVGMMGRTFHLQNNEIFNHPSFLGAAGFNFIGSSILMPATKTTNAGQSVGYVELPRLSGNCNGTLGYQHYVVDGTGLMMKSNFLPTTCRRAVFTWFDKFGVEVFGGRQLFMFQRS